MGKLNLPSHTYAYIHIYIHTYTCIHTYICVYNMHGVEYNSLLDISRQLACMKLGSREKYQPIQYCWVHISRLLGYLVSYMPFAYRYPTNLLQHPDRRACSARAVLSGCCNIYLQTIRSVYLH